MLSLIAVLISIFVVAIILAATLTMKRDKAIEAIPDQEKSGEKLVVPSTEIGGEFRVPCLYCAHKPTKARPQLVEVVPTFSWLWNRLKLVVVNEVRLDTGGSHKELCEGHYQREVLKLSKFLAARQLSRVDHEHREQQRMMDYQRNGLSEEMQAEMKNTKVEKKRVGRMSLVNVKDKAG